MEDFHARLVDDLQGGPRAPRPRREAPLPPAAAAVVAPLPAAGIPACSSS